MNKGSEPSIEAAVSRRTLLKSGAAVAGIVAAGGLAIAPGAQARQDTPVPGGTLVWGMGGDADALDPHTTAAWAAWRQSSFMYESLVAKDLSVETGTPAVVPKLAERWEVTPDGLSWTFFLRQGVVFHDGTPFNAQAVLFNYDRMKTPDSPYFLPAASHATYTFQFTTSVEVVDDFTVRFVNSVPVGEFLSLMGDYYLFGIISPTQLAAVGNDGIAAAPSGTGPFTFVERIPGERSVFAKNTTYWGTPANIDTLIVRPILEDQARVVALQTGEIDILSDVPADLIDSLVAEGYTLSIGDAPHLEYYMLNFQNEFTSNPLVRKAINHAIDRSAIADGLFLGTATAAYGLLAPGMPAFDPAFAPYPYDPDLARQLLTEAGYPDGFSGVLAATPTASGWPQAGVVAEYIQRYLSEVGIDVELELLEWVSYLGVKWNDRTDLIGWGSAFGMPTNYWLNTTSQSAFHPEVSTTTGRYNTVEAPIAELDAMLVSGAQEIDPAIANDFYRQANTRIMVEDAAYLPISHNKLPQILAPRVKGFAHAVNMNYDMARIWIEE